jgi:flavin reductase (DIM6/NTAB) family NADH-FMN oxidoreductase RutF
MPKIERLNLINSITGIKPANLIGTVGKNGITNLAIFSSVVHLGSNPALLAFIVRPTGETNRHTYENIKATGVYTINHIHRLVTTKAHYTSAKFSEEVSEFDACGFTEEYVNDFAAPFVKESFLKIGLCFKEELFISHNKTSMIIGEVEHLILPDGSVDKEGHLDLEALDGVGISGLSTYYSLKKTSAVSLCPARRCNSLFTRENTPVIGLLSERSFSCRQRP